MNHFIRLNELVTKEATRGGFMGTIQTENLTMAYTDMKAGAEIPLYQHEAEAIDIILEGILEMTIGETTCTIIPGINSTVPSQVPHSTRAITDCRVVTILHPKRN